MQVLLFFCLLSTFQYHIMGSSIVEPLTVSHYADDAQEEVLLPNTPSDTSVMEKGPVLPSLLKNKSQLFKYVMSVVVGLAAMALIIKCLRSLKVKKTNLRRLGDGNGKDACDDGKNSSNNEQKGNQGGDNHPQVVEDDEEVDPVPWWERIFCCKSEDANQPYTVYYPEGFGGVACGSKARCFCWCCLQGPPTSEPLYDYEDDPDYTELTMTRVGCLGCFSKAKKKDEDKSDDGTSGGAAGGSGSK